MFSPQPMKHVLLQVMTEDLPQVSLILAELQVFGPDYRPFHDSQYRSIPGQRFRELYHRAVSRLQKISGHVRIGSQVALNELHVVREDELEETDRWLGETWDRCSTFEENLRHQSEEQQLLDQLEQALGNFGELNIDLGLLQGERMFLDIRLGMIPRTHVGQLKEAIALANYLLFPYLEHDEMVHVIVVGPKGERERELGSVLDTAGFRPLTIPVELQGEPSRVRIELQKRRLALKQASNREREIARQFASEIRERLEECQRTLVMAEPFVRLDTAVRTGGYTSVISGWIPARDVRRTERALVAGLSNPLHIEVRNPLPEERPLVPSYMPDNRLMAPFATLVKQYGIPRYGEVDPTAIFAVTFILMFGMMFGDVGHGLTIALAAWLARASTSVLFLTKAASRPPPRACSPS